MGEDEEEFHQVVLIVKELRHPTLIREGNDLLYRCRISTAEARKGTRIKVPMLGSTKQMILPLKPSSRMRGRRRIKGRGMPIRGGAARGDIVVEIQVVSSVHKALGSLADTASLRAREVGERAWTSARNWWLAVMDAVGERLRQSERWQAFKQRAAKVAPQIVTFGVLLLVNPTYALIHAGTMLLMHFGIVEFARRPPPYSGR